MPCAGVVVEKQSGRVPCTRVDSRQSQSSRPPGWSIPVATSNATRYARVWSGAPRTGPGAACRNGWRPPVSRSWPRPFLAPPRGFTTSMRRSRSSGFRDLTPLTRYLWKTDPTPPARVHTTSPRTQARSPAARSSASVESVRARSQTRISPTPMLNARNISLSSTPPVR
jgi:hypothetical protein